MFQHILYVFGSELQNFYELDHIRELYSVENELLQEDNYGDEHVINENLQSQINSIPNEKNCNRNSCSYEGDYFMSSESSIKNNDPAMRSYITNFLVRTKKKYPKSFNNKTYENITNINSCTKIFNELFDQWEKEKTTMKVSFITYKFKDAKDYKKYRKLNRKTNLWLRNFGKIFKFFLPQIKNELERSSINKNVKISMIENINSIIRVMDYFEQLKPKFVRFSHSTEMLKFYYTTMIDRFPYLFDYFNLAGRFVYLYEMIIELYIKKVNESYDMDKILYNMSFNLEYVLKNSDSLIKDIQAMLTMLELLEPIMK
ncbi:uncharacterized protein VNE69_08178 [Vairimorpha necatrix]|uniref:Uncharacterized protein n=1 Tax=Vairimorpha necatrix TaxID=6039 RepID=A0AAX4JEZ4_9MICR